MNKNISATVTTPAAAWEIAKRIFKLSYHHDKASSDRAGYPVYRADGLQNFYNYICDLGDRLELNMADCTVNIWIDA